jgi:hypothetical protein
LIALSVATLAIPDGAIGFGSLRCWNAFAAATGFAADRTVIPVLLALALRALPLLVVAGLWFDERIGRDARDAMSLHDLSRRDRLRVAVADALRGAPVFCIAIGWLAVQQAAIVKATGAIDTLPAWFLEQFHQQAYADVSAGVLVMLAVSTAVVGLAAAMRRAH